MNERHTKVGDKEYNLTQLKANSHGLQLHRDYSAHFFRWSFARRFVNKGDHVLDVGCGQEIPFFRVITSKLGATRPASYTGVDMNRSIKTPKSKNIDVTIHAGFNMIEGWEQLNQGFYDVITCLEVIEHMSKEDGVRLLKILARLVKPKTGLVFLSTPVFNGSAAKNHIHEYTINELQGCIEAAGFTVNQRYGTFMNIREFKFMKPEFQYVAKNLSKYYDNDALSCIFAPANPNLSRNNIWLLGK